VHKDLNISLKKAAKGHKKSQFELYEQFYGYCMSVALRYSDDRENAKEIVHDAFIKAFAKLENILTESAFKPWLRRIVVNTAIDHFRKHQHEQHHLDIVDHDAVDMSENVMDKLSAEDIFKGIAQLPRGYRMVFTLYAVEGFKHEEIGIKLGITTGTSKSNLSKARIKLQKILLNMQAIKIVRNG
jgi:RNA polymerase sigma factor (sigma-70 family)